MDLANRHQGNFSRKLGIVSASVLLVFCLVVTIQAIWTHDVAIKRGHLIAEKLTKIEAENVELTINSMELTLKAQAEKFFYNSLFNKLELDVVEGELSKIVSNSPQVAWALITDANGNVSVMGSKESYKPNISPGSDLSKEAFFSTHKTSSPRIDADQGLKIFISSATDGQEKRFIILSRPMYSYDGNFTGIIAVAIDAGYFFDFYRSIEIGDKIGMGIIVNNGELLLAEGRKKPMLNLVDVIENDNELRNNTFKDLAVKRIVHDNKKYIVSFQKLHSSPVIISLVLDEAEILSSWRSDRMTDLVFLVLFTVFGAVLFSLIITMAKQIQRAEESEKKALLANQAKSEFLAKMSHELRTPLNAIIGFSEMIDNGYFGPLNNTKQKERIHDINLCGNHLLQLINDILDYSKGEAGKLEIRDSEVTLIKVVDDSVRMIREKSKKKNQVITIDVPQNLPRMIADEKKMKQIMLNLLSNAVKFTLEGGHIIIAAKMNDKDEMEISVTDTGIGIPEEEIPTALSVFGQVKSRQMLEEEGTGLGLPLCKMLTELHGGRFLLESKLGKGTKATFIIPSSRILFRKMKAT